MRISDYPFTEEAAGQVREAGYSLESLLSKTSFKTVRGRAMQRVAGAMSGAISDCMAQTDAELLAELLSYPLARVMVSCLGDPILLRRYALAEAKLAYKRMQNEKDGLAAIADDLGLHPQGPGPYKIYFAEYVRAAHGMHAPKWKLTNRDLQQGYLTITEEELKRIMEEAAREKVMRGLPLPVDERIAHPFRNTWGRSKSNCRSLEIATRWTLARLRKGHFPLA
jgi:DNA primase large subunit